MKILGGFSRIENTNSERLYCLLKIVLTSFDLKIEDFRAQCYDGAAAMLWCRGSKESDG